MYDRSCANNDIADAGVNICKITLAKLTTLIMETMLTEMINSGPGPLVRWKSRTSISSTTALAPSLSFTLIRNVQ